MPWTDSHLHFDTFEEDGSLDDVLERAADAGVGRLLAIGGTPAANERAVRLAEANPQRLGATVGLDRDEIGKQADPGRLEELADRDAVVGIGETGLDYYYGAEDAEPQRALFADMLALAARKTKPVVIHSREADDDTLDLLRQHLRDWRGDPGRVGVLHCFTGSEEFARSCIDAGLYISFSGIVTFKNASALRDVARRLPADRILVETDAPYLAPVPYRGKRNEPAYVRYVGEALAELRGCSPDELSAITTRNAAALFGLE